MSKSKFSIITPSFNQGMFIEQTILSVLDQDYKNFELIIVDGGSTDQTLDIINKYKNQIRWISEKDNGQYHAINKGLRLAEGNIITWLNSDDLFYSKSVLSTIANKFEENPSVEIIHGDYCLIDPNGQIILKMLGIPLSFNLLLYGTNPICPSAFFRRSLVDKIGEFDINLHTVGDYEFWLRAFKNNATSLLIKKFIFNVRFHSQSMSIARNDEMHKKQTLVRNDYRTRFVFNRMKTFDKYFLLVIRVIYKFKWQITKLLTRGTIDNLLYVRALERKSY